MLTANRAVLINIFQNSFKAHLTIFNINKYNTLISISNILKREYLLNEIKLKQQHLQIQPKYI